MKKLLLSLLVVLALFAAACGDDDDEGSSDPDTSADTETDAAEPADEAEPEPAEEAEPEPAEEAEPEPADEAEPEPTEEAEPEPTEEALELFDSYEGVTAESVKIGVAVIDPVQIREMFGIDLGVWPVELGYAAWADALNAEGGINGRMVEVIVSSFLPIGPADAERVCTELVEDSKVFVVIGQFLEDHMLCITDLHGLPYVGHFGETPAKQEASGGRFFATEMEQTTQRRGGVAGMIAAGDLDGRNVGLYWEGDEGDDHADAVRPLLEEAGINVVGEYGAPFPGTDTTENERTGDLFVQRMLADEVDFILNLSNITGITEAVERAGADVTIGYTNGQAADGETVFGEITAGEEVLSNTFAITTNKPTREEQLADPGVQECIEQIQTAFPDEEIDLESDDITNGITNHCRTFALTVKILDAAQADINPDSFVAAGESLGTFSLPAMATVSLSPEKHSAGADVRRYEYDPDLGWLWPVGDPIPTGLG